MPAPTSPPSPTRPLLRVLTAAALAAGLLAGCAGGVEMTANANNGPAPGEAVEIEAGDNFFEPEAVTLEAGEEVTIEITNSGRIPHDWTIDEPAVSTGVMQAGTVAHATFTVPDEDVKFVCTLHRGMEGTLRVG
jgi:plastocyanin